MQGRGNGTICPPQGGKPRAKTPSRGEAAAYFEAKTPSRAQKHQAAVASPGSTGGGSCARFLGPGRQGRTKGAIWATPRPGPRRPSQALAGPRRPSQALQEGPPRHFTPAVAGPRRPCPPARPGPAPVFAALAGRLSARQPTAAWGFVRAGSSSQPQAAHFLRCGRVVVRDHGLSHAQQVVVGPFASGAAASTAVVLPLPPHRPPCATATASPSPPAVASVCVCGLQQV